MITKVPNYFEIHYCLLSRRAIQDLILTVWGVLTPLRTITDYMKKLNFTLQKLMKHAYKQVFDSIKQWIQISFLNIKKRARNKNAEIHWLDETVVCSNSNYIREFSPKGGIHEIKMQYNYVNINMISTVTNKWQMSFYPFIKIYKHR